MTKTALTLFVLSALALGNAGAQTVVKIATISPLSGAASNLGVQVKNGALLAVNEYKAEFKALGLALQLVGYDDQADPGTGTSQARKIAADLSVLGVVGGWSSGVTIPASEALRASHVALVSPSATANQVTDRGLPNMNRIVPRDDAQGPAGGRFLAENLGAKRVYILNDKTAYGEGLAAEVEKTLKARGVQVLTNEGSEERADFSNIIAKIKLGRADAVYFGGIYNQVGVFIRQLRDAGVTIPVVGGDGYDSEELPKIAGTGATNIYFTTIAPAVGEIPAAKTVAASYRKSFGSAIQGTGVLSYDSAKVLLTGILSAYKAAGNKVPTRAQVEAAVRGGTYRNLVTGQVKFNSKGDRTSAKLYVAVIKNGQRGLAATLDTASR